jgi:hypothetical protein
MTVADRVVTWIVSSGPGLRPFTTPQLLRITRLIGSDLGQNQSGNSTLSPQAYRLRARSPNWPYRRFYRSPLSVPLDTSVGAPLWALRSRCERWQDRSVASRVMRSSFGWFSFHIIISYKSINRMRPTAGPVRTSSPRSGPGTYPGHGCSSSTPSRLGLAGRFLG